MDIIHIVGGKNHGKTTLICDLVQEFTRRGLKTASIKHTGHKHTVDAPGKDSWRFQQAGANPSIFVTPETIGVFVRRDEGEDFLKTLLPFVDNCDIVVLEGHRDGSGNKVEVWRAEKGSELFANEISGVKLIVTDDSIETTIPVVPRSDIAAIGEAILRMFSR